MQSTTDPRNLQPTNLVDNKLSEAEFDKRRNLNDNEEFRAEQLDKTRPQNQESSQLKEPMDKQELREQQFMTLDKDAAYTQQSSQDDSRRKEDVQNMMKSSYSESQPSSNFYSEELLKKFEDLQLSEEDFDLKLKKKWGLLSKMADKVLDKVANFGEKVKDTILHDTDVTAKDLELGKQDMKENLEKGQEYMSEKYEQGKDYMNQKLDQVKENNKENLEMAQDKYQEGKEYLEEKGQEMKESLDNKAQDAKEQLGEKQEQLGEAKEQAKEKSHTLTSDIKHFVVDKIKDARDLVQEALHTESKDKQESESDEKQRDLELEAQQEDKVEEQRLSTQKESQGSEQQLKDEPSKQYTKLGEGLLDEADFDLNLKSKEEESEQKSEEKPEPKTVDQGENWQKFQEFKKQQKEKELDSRGKNLDNRDYSNYPTVDSQPKVSFQKPQFRSAGMGDNNTNLQFDVSTVEAKELPSKDELTKEFNEQNLETEPKQENKNPELKEDQSKSLEKKEEEVWTHNLEKTEYNSKPQHA